MREGGPGPLHHYRLGKGWWGTGWGGGGRGLSPHSGLLRRRRGPRGGRTQGCEQHSPPENEVPLRREGAQVRARGGHGVLWPLGRAEPGQVGS